MIAEISHKTDPGVKPVICCLCEVCKREGPRVELDPQALYGAQAEEAAVAAGWVVHMESVLTPVRKKPTGRYGTQYFCPEHSYRAGSVPVVAAGRKVKRA